MSQQLFSGVISSHVHASHVLLEINQFDCCVKEQVYCPSCDTTVLELLSNCVMVWEPDSF